MWELATRRENEVMMKKSPHGQRDNERGEPPLMSYRHFPEEELEEACSAASSVICPWKREWQAFKTEKENKNDAPNIGMRTQQKKKNIRFYLTKKLGHHRKSREMRQWKDHRGRHKQEIRLQKIQWWMINNLIMHGERGKQLDHMVLGCARCDLNPQNLKNYVSAPFFCFHSSGTVTC